MKHDADAASQKEKGKEWLFVFLVTKKMKKTNRPYSSFDVDAWRLRNFDSVGNRWGCNTGKRQTPPQLVKSKGSDIQLLGGADRKTIGMN